MQSSRRGVPRYRARQGEFSCRDGALSRLRRRDSLDAWPIRSQREAIWLPPYFELPSFRMRRSLAVRFGLNISNADWIWDVGPAILEPKLSAVLRVSHRELWRLVVLDLTGLIRLPRFELDRVLEPWMPIL